MVLESPWKVLEFAFDKWARTCMLIQAKRGHISPISHICLPLLTKYRWSLMLFTFILLLFVNSHSFYAKSVYWFRWREDTSQEQWYRRRWTWEWNVTLSQDRHSRRHHTLYRGHISPTSHRCLPLLTKYRWSLMLFMFILTLAICLFTGSQAVTHPISNRARCRLTTLIEANALTTTLRRHSYLLLLLLLRRFKSDRG